MDSRDVANDCPGVTEVNTNTLDLIMDQGADVGRKDMFEMCLKIQLRRSKEQMNDRGEPTGVR